MVTTRPPKTIVKPTALGPVANTDTKLLIYGLFQKGRVLAQDGVIVFEAQPLERIRLRFDEEGEELRQINCVLAVVVVGGAADPADPTRESGGFPFWITLCQPGIAGTTGQGSADQPFEAAFTGVGRHTAASSGAASRLSVSVRASVSSSGFGASTSSGSRAAASRTSSFPVTTSAIRRVRY